MSRAWLRLALVVLVAVASAGGAAGGMSAAEAPDIGHIVVLADVHLDPLYNRSGAFVENTAACASPSANPYGTFGCDSPWPLFQAALAAAAAAMPEPDAVLLLGDVVRHDADLMPDSAAAASHIITLVSETVHAAFPVTNTSHLHLPDASAHTHILNSLGNNDVQPDYALPVPTSGTSAVLQKVADDWAQELTAGERATVAQGGYFAREALPGLTVISLNTVVYSISHTPEPAGDDPFGQFAWLEATLATLAAAEASGNATAVYLVGHIPPLLDHYGYKLQWHSQYLQRYLAVVAAHQALIRAQFFAHLHANEFRTFSPAQFPHLGAPMIMTSSITPVYNNNPGFGVLTFNRTSKELLDLELHWADLASTSAAAPPVFTKQFSYRSDFQLASMSNAAMHELAMALATDDALFAEFKRARKTSGPASAASSSGLDWSCLTRSADPAAYSPCMAAAGKTAAPTAAPTPAPTNSSATPTTTAAPTTAAPTTAAPTTNSTGRPTVAPPAHTRSAHASAAAIIFAVLAVGVVLSIGGVALWRWHRRRRHAVVVKYNVSGLADDEDEDEIIVARPLMRKRAPQYQPLGASDDEVDILVAS